MFRLIAHQNQQSNPESGKETTDNHTDSIKLPRVDICCDPTLLSKFSKPFRHYDALSSLFHGAHSESDACSVNLVKPQEERRTLVKTS